MKKLLSIILSVITLLSVFTVTVNAAEVSGECGDNVTWFLDTDTGILTISGEGDMYNYNHNTAPFKSNKDLIKSVYVEDGVASIGDYAFYSLGEITDLVIKNSSVKIGSTAFYRCSNLATVTIGDGISNSNGGNIGAYAFAYCEKLVSVVIPDGIESIRTRAFYGCSSLKSLTIPNSVKEIGWEFVSYSLVVNYSGSLTELAELKKNRGGAQYNTFICQNNIVYPSGFCGDNITWEINPTDNCLTFSGFGKMTDYNEWDSYMDDVYGPLDSYWANKITKIVINEGIETIGNYVFSEYKNLLNVSISESVTSIGDGAFRYCDKLTSITIPDSVTTIGYGVFSDCDNLTSITIPDSVTTIGGYAFEYCSGLTNITIPDSVTSIGKNIFLYCDNLSDVYYTGSREQWESISIYSYNSEFLNGKIHYNCQKVVNPLTCTEAGYITYNCSCCDVDYVYEYIEPTGHNYVGVETPATCTTHGYMNYTCDSCGKSYIDYTANPTGHTLNEDGVCEVCGEREVSTNHINTQKLTMESVLAMVMNLLAKIFGVFSVSVV